MLRVICNVSGEYTLELTTMNGTLLMVRNSADPEYILDISALASGIYLMSIRSGDFLSTQKIVKY